MEAIIIALVFISGLFVGSFLNLCICRVPDHQSIITLRSKCDNCGETIKTYDLIPVISYIILKGKCRKCKEKISIRNVYVEILTGIVFVISYMYAGLSLLLPGVLFLMCTGIIIIFIDIDHHIINDELVMMVIGAGVLFNAVTENVSILHMIYGFLIGLIIFLVIALLGPMGGGDIKLMAAYGIWLGVANTFMAMIISFVLGGVIGMILIILKKKTRKDYIPFGPFIVLGMIVTFLFGTELIEIYFDLLMR